MRLSLTVLLMATPPLQNICAEEIPIRCDHIGPPGAILLIIDTNRKSVQWGKGESSTTFIDRREYQTRDKDESQNEWGPGSVGCVREWSEFVHISEDRVEFGKSSINTDWCGRVDRPTAPRSEKRDYAYSVDRTTGLANLSNDTTRQPDYECQRYSGNAF
jgi:hypothetical protein